MQQRAGVLAWKKAHVEEAETVSEHVTAQKAEHKPIILSLYVHVVHISTFTCLLNHVRPQWSLLWAQEPTELNFVRVRFRVSPTGAAAKPASRAPYRRVPSRCNPAQRR